MTELEKASRYFVFAGVAVVVFSLTYTGVRYLEVPLPKYFPVVHEWSTAARKDKGPGMSWYAILGVSLAAGVAAGACASLAAGRLVKPEGAAAAFLCTLSIAASVAMCAFTLWHEYSEWFVPK